MLFNLPFKLNLFLFSQIIVPFEIVSVFHAKARINELFGKDFYRKRSITAVQAALERHFYGLIVIVPEKHIAHFQAVTGLSRFLPRLYVSVQFAIFCYRMPPELTGTARFLAFFKLDSLFLFVFRQLHGNNLVKFFL